MPYSSVNAVNQFSNYELKAKRFLSSSLSDHSGVSSSSDTESTSTVSDPDKTQIPPTQEEIAMEKALKKMQKLDRILMGKMKEEREVAKKFYCMQSFHFA